MAAFLHKTSSFGQTFAYLSRCKVVWSGRLTIQHLPKCCGRTGLQFALRALSTTPPGTGTVTKVTEEAYDDYRERFIPITRRSIVRHVMQKDNFLSENEKKHYEDFALSLDSAIVNKYHGVLNELKALFDPINPDKDTVETRKWTPRERQDNEFWLLQRLEDLMEKANFHALPRHVVDRALADHEVIEGVRIVVDARRYDVLKFWALGKEIPAVNVPWYQALFRNNVAPAKPKVYYKRIVVAIRRKTDQKLMLKSFKEIPVNALEMLLPDGKITISKLDYGIIAASVGLATIGVVTKIVTVLVHINMDWMLLVTGVTGLAAIQALTAYKNKRNKYLAAMSNLLYFKNIANNRGLLALLVDRAEDESLKEALLIYSFLLANRTDAVRLGGQQQPTDLGNIPEGVLVTMIEQWIRETTGTKVEFDASEGVRILTRLGILSEKDEKLYVLPLNAAIRNLPQQPHSLVARATESDISEGYDRDAFLETEEQYKKAESRSKGYGWL